MTIDTPPALPGPVELAASLREALPKFGQIEWFKSTSSTNADLIAKTRTSLLRRPWLLGSHLQENGRGRAGRTWQNRAGANLMFSCAFDVFLAPRQLPALSPLVGMVTCEALRQLLDPANRRHLSLKWPNDLLWKFAKLAGILVETTKAGTSRVSPDHHVVVVGMGVNLDDARALSQSLDRQVADWREVCGQAPEAARLSAATLVSCIAQSWYDSINLVVRDGLADLPERFARVDALSGQHVNILDDGRLIQSGIAGGVNDLGQLIVRTPQGEHPISVGDVSVRSRS